MSLDDYKRKRDFSTSPEPAGGEETAEDNSLIFVCQEHYASQHHFDFRLQCGDLLVSWAVPKGPSFDPTVKRLAVRTEDHPLAYASFEGEIPQGEYGAGRVTIWDEGTYRMEDFPTIEEGLARGAFRFTLYGQRMKGSWKLVHMKGKNWLLIKRRDEHSLAEEGEKAKRRQ